ncbi:hypothetical protein KJ966_29165 [bacterium]|nr:hypothetical protein [bacterium]
MLLVYNNRTLIVLIRWIIALLSLSILESCADHSRLINPKELQQDCIAHHNRPCLKFNLISSLTGHDNYLFVADKKEISRIDLKAETKETFFDLKDRKTFRNLFGFLDHSPQSMVVSEGVLFVSDTLKDSILRIDTKSSKIEADTILDENILLKPKKIIVENNILYIADSGNHRIIGYDLHTQKVTEPFSVENFNSKSINGIMLNEVEYFIKNNNILWFLDTPNFYKIDLTDKSIRRINTPLNPRYSDLRRKIRYLEQNENNIFFEIVFDQKIVGYSKEENTFFDLAGCCRSYNLSNGIGSEVKLGSVLAMTIHDGIMYIAVHSGKNESLIRKIDLKTRIVTTL